MSHACAGDGTQRGGGNDHVQCGGAAVQPKRDEHLAGERHLQRAGAGDRPGVWQRLGGQLLYRSDNFRLQRIQVGSSVLGRQYGYGAVGNVISTTDALNGESLSYTYDPLDRLTGVSGALSEAYTYDPIGTMTRQVEGSVTYTQTWDLDNRLVSVTTDGWTTQYLYDSDGVLVRKVEPRGQTLYGNADYELFTATLITVTIPSTFTHKLYMPIAFGASTGACQGTCTYYQFNGQQVAVRTGGTVYRLHSDHLGSASATTDGSGMKVSELRY